MVQKLQSALGEAIEENDALREKVAELEALLAESEEDRMHKDKAIKELYDLIQKKEKEMKAMRQTIEEQSGELGRLREDVDRLMEKVPC